MDDESRQNLSVSTIKSDITQAVDLKTPERLRFEQDTKHLMEKVKFTTNETVNLSIFFLSCKIK